ncbi:sporulation protein [Clostridium sp. A1-XYC3]|uniref:Sporulation protein n=1 Tax=Clostridium tanneri TaxID=3037988 RepID=A0ABU4JQ71_9CLOT|nr:sporulation protein [Clostridium sp. A1-XYC3]MDW8800308.1 sporulation protein [Clostridium sp. A1-XYC3]
MGLFKKILLTVGVGGAEVNTEILQSTVRIGEDIEGVVNILGGSAEQNIDRVEVELKTEYIKEVDDVKQKHRATLVKLVVGRDIAISPNERKQIPFTFRVPEHTPISMNRKTVWVETELEIPLAIDPEDRDYIEIRPSNTMEVVLDAVLNVLGFRLREVECKAGYIGRSEGGFLQEFEFVPQSAFRGVLDELEITFLPSSEGVNLFMQIDRRARGFKSFMQEAAGLDEKHIILTISDYDASQGSRYVAEILENTINNYC